MLPRKYQTGAYVGTEDIVEHVRFVLDSPPLLTHTHGPGQLARDFANQCFGPNECVVLSASNVKMRTDAPLAKRGCLEFTVGIKLHFSVSGQDGSDFKMHRVNAFYSGAGLQYLFENMLDTSCVRNYVCDTVLASKCENTFALNGLTLDSC